VEVLDTLVLAGGGDRNVEDIAGVRVVFDLGEERVM